MSEEEVSWHQVSESVVSICNKKIISSSEQGGEAVIQKTSPDGDSGNGLIRVSSPLSDTAVRRTGPAHASSLSHSSQTHSRNSTVLRCLTFHCIYVVYIGVDATATFPRRFGDSQHDGARVQQLKKLDSS